jgi:hypothetical protein
MIDFNFKRSARERAIAAEIANDLYRTFQPAMESWATADFLLAAENRATFAHIFGAACERNGLQTEAEATRVLNYVPKAMAPF